MLMREPSWGGRLDAPRVAETEDCVQAGDSQQPPDHRLGIHQDELVALCRQPRTGSQKDRQAAAVREAEPGQVHYEGLRGALQQAIQDLTQAVHVGHVEFTLEAEHQLLPVLFGGDGQVRGDSHGTAALAIKPRYQAPASLAVPLRRPCSDTQLEDMHAQRRPRRSAPEAEGMRFQAADGPWPPDRCATDRHLRGK